MTAGELAAWAAAIIAGLALVISCCSAVLAWKSLRWEKLSAEAATRSAEAAERANRLAEQAIDARLSKMISATDSSSVDLPPPDAPDVRWRIERPSENRYVLRNIGTAVAVRVEVDPQQAGPVTRNLPQGAVIRPGEGCDMLIMGTWGHPVPNQLYVRWDGHDDWAAVPIGPSVGQ